MIAWKFLSAGAVGPFSRHQWLPGTWVDAVRAQEGYGVHACRPSDLAFWVGEELWRIELQGTLLARETQIEASRGRLLDRVTAWDRDAWTGFGLACVLQARDVAAGALRRLGEVALADRFGPAATLEDLVAAVRSAQAPAGFAGEMFGYARDAAIAFSMTGNAAESSFIASIATAAARGTPEGFAEEKRRESRWIAGRLSLPAA